MLAHEVVNAEMKRHRALMRFEVFAVAQPLILKLPRRLNLHCAFAGDMRPNPPRPFSLSHPDN